jgi:hypothetical protein
MVVRGVSVLSAPVRPAFFSTVSASVCDLGLCDESSLWFAAIVPYLRVTKAERPGHCEALTLALSLFQPESIAEE